MKKIQLSNGNFTTVDDSTFGLLSQYKWTQDHVNRGYVITANPFFNERRMHRLIMGAKPGQCVDHIDGDSLNNQYSNLRLCTRQQNLFNKKLYKNNTSGYKGVIWDKRLEVYIAQLKYNGKLKYLGFSGNPKVAAKIYNEGAIKYFGEFARLNQL